MVEQDEARNRWDRRAARYDATSPRAERLMVGDSRDWICSRASGRTLEVAAGTGRNFDFYPPDVTLTAIDLSPGMLAKARQRAAASGQAVEFAEGAAEKLPYPDDTFDTVVCTLAICSVADRDAAVAEMTRVLRSGGWLLLVDHWERRWRRGRPADLLARHGLRVEQRSRIRLGLIDRVAARKLSADPVA
jgi:ubiquinone/menaquinone biosynthesis C-methylase UbiE